MKQPSPTVQINNDYLKQTLVFTKNGEIFRFNNPQENYLVEHAVVKVYDTWERFEKDTTWTLDQLRSEFKNLFGKTPPKKYNSIDLCTHIYHMWATKAKDRTTKPTAPNASPKLTNRTYHVLPGDQSVIKTPQALECLKIITEACGDKTSIKEDLLKKAFDEQGARLKTRQLPWRIFQYYRPVLISNKLLRYE